MGNRFAENIRIGESLMSLIDARYQKITNGFIPYIIWSSGGRKLGAGGEVLETYPPHYILSRIEEKPIDGAVRVLMGNDRYAIVVPEDDLDNSRRWLIDYIGGRIEIVEVT